jgi:hypothetical protein
MLSRLPKLRCRVDDKRRGRDVRSKLMLGALVGAYLRRNKVDTVSPDGRAQIKREEPYSVAQTPVRTPVSVMTSGTNAKHPIRIQK